MKLSKKELHTLRCASAYEELNEIYNLSDKGSPESQVHELIMRANDVLTQICEHADMIKIDLYEDVADSLPKEDDGEKSLISAGAWKNFVSTAAQVQKSGILDKVCAKYERQEKSNAFNDALRDNFLRTYLNGGAMEIPEPSSIDVVKKDKIETFTSPDFDINLSKAVTIRHKLNDELWPEFRKHAEAAEHLTQIPYADFKDLVDWEHYKRGGYPTETSKPRFWAMFEKVDRAVRLLRQYEFSQGHSIPKQFGWDINISERHPSCSVHSEVADAWRNYTIIKPLSITQGRRMGLLDTDILILKNENKDTGECLIVDDETAEPRATGNIRQMIERLNPEERTSELFTTKGIHLNFNRKLSISPYTVPFLGKLKELGYLEMCNIPTHASLLSKLYRPLTNLELNILGTNPYYNI